MARLRKNDTTVNTSPAAAASAAAPARRRTAAAPRNRSKAQNADNINAKSTTKSAEAPEEMVAEDATDITSAPLEFIETTSEAVLVETAGAPAAEYAPSREEIAALAYSYWVDRNYAPGCPELDWLRAEAELRQRGNNR